MNIVRLAVVESSIDRAWGERTKRPKRPRRQTDVARARQRHLIRTRVLAARGTFSVGFVSRGMRKPSWRVETKACGRKDERRGTHVKARGATSDPGAGVCTQVRARRASPILSLPTRVDAPSLTSLAEPLMSPPLIISSSQFIATQAQKYTGACPVAGSWHLQATHARQTSSHELNCSHFDSHLRVYGCALCAMQLLFVITTSFRVAIVYIISR
jgi:hypothetical protein